MKPIIFLKISTNILFSKPIIFYIKMFGQIIAALFGNINSYFEQHYKPDR